jgi:hypothetical protein
LRVIRHLKALNLNEGYHPNRRPKDRQEWDRDQRKGNPV